MTTFQGALQIIQVILSVSLIIVIILQGKGAGLGSLFGGGDSGMGLTKTRRGLDRTLFQITIILVALFIINAVVLLMIQPSV
jgi:preprotein translocase subunit SecG